ncbi:MAG: hypothetical protein SVM80_05380 [Halobacteriota archaeon]|nr:hypothetical protein [Halobacteriota archaeon]
MRKILLTALLILVICTQIVSATSVSRLYLCNLEYLPGDVRTELISLSEAPSEMTGHWYAYYMGVEGDSEKMNITSWITVTPTDYTIKENETLTFTVTITVPEDAKPGLYGATSEEANILGHIDERRTFIIYADKPVSTAEGGGQGLATGLMIPVSVIVLGEESIFLKLSVFLTTNLTYILFAMIIVLLIIMLRRK